MNFLAHLYLSPADPESLIGNLAGDFVKGRLDGRFTPRIARGIETHRRVDAFTDGHPEVSAMRRMLFSSHGHYARVIVDLFLDHFLASDFEALSGEPLEVFVARVHGALDARIDDLPGRLRTVYPLMRDSRWLVSYRDVRGIHIALTNMSRRLARPHRLETATVLLTESRAELEAHFRRFMPEVVSFARSLTLSPE